MFSIYIPETGSSTSYGSYIEFKKAIEDNVYAISEDV
jgi:hypothetical protein